MIKLAEVLKLLLLVSCVLSASENDEKRELSEHYIAKDRLFKWIKENNDTDSLYCHTNTDDIYEDTFLSDFSCNWVHGLVQYLYYSRNQS